ncbi:unnamed protein product [Microthlaspi erraticum]|uniref:Uncharacterized protein n=1 Tax=Microthlaspi erraticum TaxID=1685480 RepID=A0A6D2IE89_9BRAS|nr:unnamed protein product [Microthlaspi erraticum]
MGVMKVQSDSSEDESRKLTGSFPHELGNMSKVHYRLHDNRLTSHKPLSISLGKLTDLFHLKLRSRFGYSDILYIVASFLAGS